MRSRTPGVAGHADLTGERLGGLGEPVAVGEDLGEPVDDVVAQLRVGDGFFEGCPEVVDGGRRFGEQGGTAQFVEDRGPLLERRRFAQGAGEVAAGRVGGSGALGLVGGGAQLLDEPVVAVGVGLHEVAGGGGGSEALVDDTPRGLAVQGHADAAGDGAVDGGGDERVDELQSARGGHRAGEDAGAAQGVRRVGGLLGAEPGDGGGQGGRDLRTEDRAGPGEAHGRGAEPFEAGDETAALDGCGEVAQQMGPGLGRDQSAVADLRRQLDRLEGVARRDGPALVAEGVVGLGAEVLADETGDGGGAERFEVEGALAGTSGQPPERLGVVGSSSGR